MTLAINERPVGAEPSREAAQVNSQGRKTLVPKRNNQ
jgi:hypothetical protein